MALASLWTFLCRYFRLPCPGCGRVWFESPLPGMRAWFFLSDTCFLLLKLHGLCFVFPMPGMWAYVYR